MKVTSSEDSRASTMMGFGGDLEPGGGSSNGNEEGASATESIQLKRTVHKLERTYFLPRAVLYSYRCWSWQRLSDQRKD